MVRGNGKVQMTGPLSDVPGLWTDGQRRRWSAVATAGPYVLLAVLVAFTVVLKYGQPGSLLIDLALCAAAAGWILGMFTLRPGWRERPQVMTVFVAGLILITAVLVVRDPWFGFFTTAAYFYAFRVLPWPWMLPGVAVVAVVAGTAQASGVDKSTALGLVAYLTVLVMNMLPMSGLAWFIWRNGRRHDVRDQALAEVNAANRRLSATLAENAGLHRQLMDQARQAGVHDERQRMAREIHDTLAQGLTGIITQLQAAEQAGADPARWRRHVAAATSLARESLVEARRSVHALRPEPLRTTGLSEALAEIAGRWSALHGIAVAGTTTGTARPMPADTETALLRTAQEALANVAKHAGAGRVGLTLSYLDHQVALDVRDDGRGFAAALPGTGSGGTVAAHPGTGAGGGFGLVSMRQRIEGLAGTLKVESEPGTGTAVSACVPVPAGVPA